MTTGEISAIVLQEANADNQSDAATADDSVKLLNPNQLPVDASKIIKIGTVSKKKYVRVGVTTVNHGASVNLTVDGIGFLGNSVYAPADTDSTIDGSVEN